MAQRVAGLVRRAGRQVGAGLVLYRQLPKIKKYLAYLPEGPVIDWAEPATSRDWLRPLAEHVKAAGAFGVRIGPPVVARRWGAETIKAAIADERITRLSEAMPDEVNHDATRIRNQLRELGWHPPDEEEGFAAGQPRFVFQLPIAGKTPEQLLSRDEPAVAAQHQEGGQARRRGRPRARSRTWPQFHPLYVETAERDHFTPRPLSYFQTMFDALLAEDPDRIRLYLAHHEGDLVAATTWVRVGEHAWYSYGASSTAKREVRGSNAIQWRMITDALAAGATRLRPARHHRGARGRRPAPRADPVQGGHRRRGGGVPRRVGPAAQPPALQGVRPLHEAALMMARVDASGSTGRPLARAPAHGRRGDPRLVPVIKGNGYGYGLRRLAEESAAARRRHHRRRACRPRSTLVRDAFAGDVVILNPWDARSDRALELLGDPRVITTVSRLADLQLLADRQDAAPGAGRGAAPRCAGTASRSRTCPRSPGCWTGSTSRAGPSTCRCSPPVATPRPNGWAGPRWPPPPARCGSPTCRPRRPSPWPASWAAPAADPVPVRLRVGTRLWLGDGVDPAGPPRPCWTCTGFAAASGPATGSGSCPADGWIVVVAGGTSHGIGLEAPTSASTVRQRAIALATGSLEAAGLALSPYTINGRKRWFLEPPHMQSSLVFLPAKETPPAIGDEVPVELRLTTATVDRIVD